MPFVVPQQQPERQKSNGEGYSRDRDGYSAGRGGDMNRQQPGPAYRPPQQQQQRGGGGYDPWQQQRQMQYRQPRYQPQRQTQPQYNQYQQPQRGRDPYGQQMGGRQYQPPQQRGYQSQGRQQMPQPDPYAARSQRGYNQGQQYQPQGRQQSDPFAGSRMSASQQTAAYDRQHTPEYMAASQRQMDTERQRQEMAMYNRPQQGNYVGEGVYADGTPMPGYEQVNMPSVMPSSYGQSLIQSNGGPAGGVYSNFNQTPEVNGGVTPRAYLEEDDVYNKPMYTRRGGGGIR